jgi:hypothetical protein
MSTLNKKGQYLVLEETPNGNLKISITEDGIKAWEDSNARDADEAFSELFEDIQCNSELLYFDDCSILGNLSNAPAITDGVNQNDSGNWEWSKDAIMWYYDNYMITSFMAKLLEEKEVIFTKS